MSRAAMYEELEHRQLDAALGEVVPLIRAQHRQLEDALDRVSAGLAILDEAAFCGAVGELDVLLSAHQAAEERMLAHPRATDEAGRPRPQA